MNVSAIIVTRGDVDLKPVLKSLPEEWEVIVWDNGVPLVKVIGVCEFTLPSIQDLSVYGRYAAIEHASHDLIYTQDDDCVTDPAAIVQAWIEHADHNAGTRLVEPDWFVTCNMPQEFRHDFYTDHALVGFGAAFHRDAPGRAFSRFFMREQPPKFIEGAGTYAVVDQPPARRFDAGPELTVMFKRTCDIVFTALTPRVLVDVPKSNLWWAEDESRMYRQPQHVEERQRMLELVRRVRDGS